ncbi:MAG: winged-helix domain-containing protein [Nitrososphaeria archaeon]
MNASALTPRLALKEIYEIVCGEDSRKLPSPSMLNKINNKLLLRKNVALAITLDNFDRMSGIENLLWNVNHLMESVGRIGLILISTSEFEIRNLVGGRLFSRLKPEFYEFKPYSTERFYEILEQRIKWAYGNLIIDEKALLTLCDFVAEECNSNVRYLFKLFLDSANIASRSGESGIGVTTIKEVIEKEKQLVVKSKLSEIRKHNPRMYEVLKIIAELQGKQQVYTGLIREEIKRKGLAISERSLDYHLNNLESKGLIELKPVRKAGGKTKEIRLKISGRWISG